MLRNGLREVCSGQDGHCWGLLGISSVVWIQSLVQSGNEYLVMVSRMQTFHPKYTTILNINILVNTNIMLLLRRRGNGKAATVDAVPHDSLLTSVSFHKEVFPKKSSQEILFARGHCLCQ